MPEERHEHLRDLLIGAVKITGAVLCGQTEACSHLLGGTDLQPVFQLLSQLLTDTVCYLTYFHGLCRNILALHSGADEDRQSLLVQRLMHIGSQNLFEFFLNLLAERQYCVTLGLLGTETGTVFKYLNLGIGILTKFVRCSLCISYDDICLLFCIG